MATSGPSTWGTQHHQPRGYTTMAGQSPGRSRQGPYCAAQAHLHQLWRKARGLQRQGLGQSELI